MMCHRALAWTSAAFAVWLALGAGCKGKASKPASDSDAAAPPSVTLTSAAQMYSLDAVPEFHLQLDQEAMDRLAKKPRKLVRATFQHGAQKLEVGLRFKGHRAMRKWNDKPAFKIRFDRYVEGQRFLGLRGLTLNNLVEDPTLVRETLGYRLFRAAGVPAPRTGYAKVYVNGQYFGLYLNVESIGAEFLAQTYADPSGNLYEGEYGCDLYADDLRGFELDGGSDEGRRDLERLIAAAEATPEALLAPEGPLDKRVLAFLAVSAFLGDFDGYRHSHNYRLYHEPAAGTWTLIPWGLDRVFKKRLALYDSGGRLAKLCFGDAACRRRYVVAMHDVLRVFAELELARAMDEIVRLVDSAARADRRRPHRAKATLKARNQLRTFLRERADEVRTQVACWQGSQEIDADGDGFGCMDCNDADPAIHPNAAEVCDGVDSDCSALADDDPACPCPAVVIDGSEFALCNLPVTWEEAAASCAARGLALARVDSATQSRALYEEAMKANKVPWWIGMNDRAVEGTWLWHDGSAVGETFWKKGEPDNSTCNQDCAVLKSGSKGRWHDTHCAQRRPFICRKHTRPGQKPAR
jgi:hypothetical protein